MTTNWKVGDKFKVIGNSRDNFEIGSIVEFVDDAGAGLVLCRGIWNEKEENLYMHKDELVPLKDMVNSPSHYKRGKIECIDAIEAALSPEEFIGYLKGNILKYTWRNGHKDVPEQEARKAAWYNNKLIECLKTKQNPVEQAQTVSGGFSGTSDAMIHIK